MTIRKAIITFDPHRVAQWDMDAECRSIFWMIREALAGRDYPRERGLLSIEMLDEPPSRVVQVPRMRLGRQDRCANNCTLSLDALRVFVYLFAHGTG